jgi:hypothetical protein
LFLAWFRPFCCTGYTLFRPCRTPISDSPLQRAFVLGPIALGIQINQLFQKLLAAHIWFCCQPLGDQVGMGFKGICPLAALSAPCAKPG